MSASMRCREMTTSTFTKHSEFIYKGMNIFYSEHEILARQCVENVYGKDGKGRDSEGIIKVDVSFDRTWLTRGHKSHIGAAFVIDNSTGIVLD